MLLPHMVCNTLVAGGRMLGVEQQAMRPAIIICSTCFGHSYAHHQELETILVLLPHMVCNAGYESGMREAARAASLIPDA